jgi:phenylalanyl-tRNA synthetase beta chain
MTISYNWLQQYLPSEVEPERLSKILTAVGLEVESLEAYESLKGGLKGLVIGQVITCEKHPNADKLSVTTVDIGSGEPLQIVCGAPNVAAGQKVIVATVGATIYPSTGEPMTMKNAKIRGIESFGMICAEDEIGLSEDHAGILVLPDTAKVGTPAAQYFKIYNDWVFEIGLTPNRMDAMSHLGVARDVCAYLTHHDKKDNRVRSPFSNNFHLDESQTPFAVEIANQEACERYAGISITGVKVEESPEWLQNRLRAIGQRPINNIVDITNYILHETGQPLHAFDAAKVKGRKIIVQNVAEGTPFVTLDNKERKLSADDLMICNGEGEPMCIAGVFGGLGSGVTNDTTEIFLESAWFNPVTTRKTSFRHQLRTDAATHFEKNVDISNTVQVLKHAAVMIKEIAGGKISSEIVDVYPDPKEKVQIVLKFHYLRKLSGKNYHSDSVKKILSSLGFEIIKEGMDDLWVAAPYSKPDVTLPADVVEEIMRIDGLDNIDIPVNITLSPSMEADGYKALTKQKVTYYLVSQGFNEIFTNSITNAAYYDAAELENAVVLLNNLSANHNMMRPSMLETGLEAVAHNINRKNSDLQFFEFGKTYHKTEEGKYYEQEHLCLYLTGKIGVDGWNSKAKEVDHFYLKGLVQRLIQLTGIDKAMWELGEVAKLNESIIVKSKNQPLISLGKVSAKELKRFDIKQTTYFIDINWKLLLEHIGGKQIKIKELPKQLPVYRDLALVVSQNTAFAQFEQVVRKLKLDKLKEVKLFDLFESEKLGKDKKSLALNFTFLDEQQTMLDAEINAMMDKIIKSFEKELQAEIRK